MDGYELRFPGDPEGPAYLVYNCRCTTLSWVKGFEGDTVKSSPKMGYMSFEEWVEGHENESSLMSSVGVDAAGNPHPGETISPEDLELFAKEVQRRGYRFVAKVPGVRKPVYGGFEHFRGSVDDLYKILDELNASRRIWPERLKRKGLLIGYQDMVSLEDFARTEGRSIFFNKRIYDDPDFLEAAYLQAVEEGVFAKGTGPASVPWHELGHVLQREDRRLYPRLIAAISKRGDFGTIALKLTSCYGITEVDMGYPELLSELLSASRSTDKETRESAQEVLREVFG